MRTLGGSLWVALVVANASTFGAVAHECPSESVRAPPRAYGVRLNWEF